jgi:hypothetical protein
MRIFPHSPYIGGSRGNYSVLKRKNALSLFFNRVGTLSAYGAHSLLAVKIKLLFSCSDIQFLY